jgi:ATP-dependent Clp protease ATP-binding subunit ClpC
VLSLAQEEAERLNHNYIGSEHILVGLLLEDGGVAGRVLRELGLETARVQAMVERLAGGGSRTPFSKVELSPSTKRILELGIDEARRMGQHYISTEHLLLALVRQNEGLAIDVLRRFGVSADQIRRETRRMLRDSPTPASEERGSSRRGSSTRKEKSKTPLVDQLATDLTALAAEGKLDPVIGRQTEIERVIQILARRTKNNPALIGEPGVGKTAIVEGWPSESIRRKRPTPAQQALLAARRRQSRRRHHVPRAVRGTAQARHRRAQKLRLDPLYRRGPHARRRRLGRQLGRRRQHPQAGPRARRTAVHRRHNA